MTSSGTYNFTLSNGESALAALERAGVAPTSVSTRHMTSCRREINLLFVEWSNKQVNLWKVVQSSVTLVAGTSTYAITPQTVMILDAWITTTPSLNPQSGSDRYIVPISRTEYASFSNKQAPGPPTVYWFDRLIAPTITTWPVADNAATYTFNYYRVDQIQDANFAGGETPDVPYLWLDALVAGLSHRLARIYTPAIEAARKIDAAEAWAIAATQNTENVPLYIIPGIRSYFPR
jgi:hypothetical protein